MNPGEKRVASHTKGMAFGNILFGGLVGAGIDMADGAAYDYPIDIVFQWVDISANFHQMARHGE